MIDTHCHIHSPEFELTRNDLILSLKDQNIQAIIVGTDIEDSKKAIALANQYPFLYASIGIHPHEYDTYSIDSLVSTMSKIIESETVVAIGECGFDFYYHTVDEVREKQEALFCMQIDLALKYKKPLIIHTRESFQETYDVLSQYQGLTIILHCFTGNKQWVEMFNTLDHTMYYSFSGIVTFHNAQDIQDSVMYVPADRLLAETDSPYLAPIPHRGQQNTPLLLPHTISKIAELRNIDVDTMNQILDTNAKKAFSL